eukprot:TRINITY_DN570_c0_g1_i1.p1 TRINITY_DN570_c0_g1~~TRINITY_DN570_c0_g1_i1.p1  ORF type:complete len:666 (+),score=227.02 TRINITY_DN570_c0_g1_i1:78-2000(+)
MEDIQLQKGFSKIIVVDNIPIVTSEKFDKLSKVLGNFFKKWSAGAQVTIPQDENGSTKGFMFVEFPTKEETEKGILKANNYPLDAKHIFKVNTYDEMKRILETSEEYKAPELQPYEPRENFQEWLLDDREMDQYVMRYGDQTEVVWNDVRPGEKPESVVKRQGWSDLYVNWSPKGSYLLTIYSGGVALWGGQKWSKVNRFVHTGVKLVDFSPCERYLITASPQYQTNDNPEDPQCIIVWDIRSGRKLRGFRGGSNTQWPVFKWSFDGNYIARVGEDVVSVYNVPAMDLLDKKSIKAIGVKEVSWSPTELLLTYFSPGDETQKPTIVVTEIPSKKERRSKTLFDATECKLNWHPNGTYLCLKIDRQKKKTTTQGFEVFRIKERDMPIELLDVKDTAHAFAWEPNGNRFAVIHGKSARSYDISFYVVEKTIKLLKTLEKRNANHLSWSPQGHYIVLAGLNMSGSLEFFNVDDMETMGTADHFNNSSIEWDPTGRYVTSVLSHWRHPIENGYNIYSFKGTLLKSVLEDKFYQLLWRPRPPTPLSDAEVQEIKKNLDSYGDKYKQQEALKVQQEEEARKQKRVQKKKDFENYLKSRRDQFFAKEQAARRELRDGEDSDDESQIYYVERPVEELIDEVVSNLADE